MGPYATQILADFGADVIKVEPPDGDVMRYAWPFRNPGMGHIFLNANRNKRSMVLDLKQPAAREACLALAKKADVLVYNIRPQAMARLKLAYEDVQQGESEHHLRRLLRLQPARAVRGEGAYDDLIQGAAGIPCAAQEAGRGDAALRADHRRRPLGRPAGGERGERGALLPRENRQGPARRRADVRAPAADRARRAPRRLHLRAAARRARATRACSRPTGGPTRRRTATSARSSTTTSSGRRSSASSAGPRCCGRPEFATQEARSQNYDARLRLRRRGDEEAHAPTNGSRRSRRADIPVQRMNSLDDIVADPHLAAIGYFRTVEHPSEGRSARWPCPRSGRSRRPSTAATRRAWASTRARCCARPASRCRDRATDRSGRSMPPTEASYNPFAPICDQLAGA